MTVASTFLPSTSRVSVLTLALGSLVRVGSFSAATAGLTMAGSVTLRGGWSMVWPMTVALTVVPMVSEPGATACRVWVRTATVGVPLTVLTTL